MKKGDVIIFLLIIFVIFFMIFIVKYMQDERTQCLKDPLGYFEGKNEGAECNCMKDGQFYKPFQVSFNLTG